MHYIFLLFCTNASFNIAIKCLLGMVVAVISLVAHMIENLPAMQETWVQSLGQEDPLEKGTAIH